MASRITSAQKEAAIYGLQLGMHPKEIAESVGLHVRRVYEYKAMLNFSQNNQPKQVKGWKEKLKYDFKRIFRKNGS